MLLRPFQTRLPHCSAKPHDLEECNRPTVFAAANRYSLITIGVIKTDLRTACPVTPFSATLPPLRMVRPSDPLICMRAFGGDPHTAHTTLAVVLDPLACEIFEDAFLDFGDPPFLLDWPEPTKLSRKGSITNLAGLTDYH